MIEDNNIKTSIKCYNTTKNTVYEHLSLLCDNPDDQALGAGHSNQYIFMDCHIHESIK